MSVTNFMNNTGYCFKTAQLSSSQSSFTGDKLKELSYLPDRQRLENTVLTNGLSKRRELSILESPPGLVRIRDDTSNLDLYHPSDLFFLGKTQKS